MLFISFYFFALLSSLELRLSFLERFRFRFLLFLGLCPVSVLLRLSLFLFGDGRRRFSTCASGLVVTALTLFLRVLVYIAQ